jgi:ethanolamine utilization protein EutP
MRPHHPGSQVELHGLGHSAQGRRWRFMLIGPTGVGKTSLLAALEHREGAEAIKTQMIDYSGWGIDTPGEYSELGHLRRALVTVVVDADVLVVAQLSTSTRSVFPPNYFLMFNQDTIGVVTQVDLPGADVERASGLLREVGITGSIFPVSVVTGAGISELRDLLQGQIVSSKE